MAKDLPVVLMGLDPGTSENAVVIAIIYKGSLELVGAGESPSVGIHKGVIENPALAARSIKQAVEKAEKMAGVRVNRVSVSYCSANVKVLNSPGSFSLNGPSGSCPGKERPAVTGIDPALAAVPPGQRIIEHLPAPLTGTTPGVEQDCGRVLTAPSEDIANLIECAHLAGLAVQEVVYSPLACSCALLTPAEIELGTILIDIGAGITSVSIFNRGSLRETTVLPLGGEHLAGDLAIGLSLSLTRAVEILREYRTEEVPGGEDGGPGSGVCDAVKGKNSRELVHSIIEARLTEIFTLAGEVIRGFDYPGALPGGVVIHGGVSQLSGISRIAENILQMPVRIGRLQNPGPDLSPTFANALGLVKYRFSRLQGDRKLGNRWEQNKGFVGKIFNWFEDRTRR
ncbi:MAG TPA: cell division protein FtsA [Bacillota bacterium]|nr:cell division protein FtsA [Peptococcaceae bacterium]HQD75644.1 cell division protein FtsA [Bacillota bacterium]